MKTVLFAAGLFCLLCLAVPAAVAAVWYVQACRLAKKHPVLRLRQQRMAAADYTPLSRIPAALVSFLVALEDQAFYDHHGYDPVAIWYALRINLQSRCLRRGGSTITQQLVKNLYFSFDKTLRRKVMELFLAIRTEKALTKEEILELYLNMVYFGRGQWGISAAADYYFDRSPAALTCNQCLMLTAVLPAPDLYNPVTDPAKYLTVREKALTDLVARKRMTQDEADQIRGQFPLSRPDDALMTERPIPTTAGCRRNPLAFALRQAHE